MIWMQKDYDRDAIIMSKEMDILRWNGKNKICQQKLKMNMNS